MSKTAEVAAFRSLREQLRQFSRENPQCSIDHESEKAILFRLGSGEDFSLVEVAIGSFELRTELDVGWSYEILQSEKDVNRLLAACDSIMAGRGVSIAGPNGYPVRSWLFLNSRGVREAMTSTAVSIRSCRRARSIKKSAWHRRKLLSIKGPTF
ncbi:hypothetical protein [Brevundimonas sp. MEB006b]|uniref:hypothetical protein n=1 Tax=Brevundimonas sp. MEB006b TaxID=3040283 RepID=UPI00254BC2A0|nr:hypothetical protein [Brevundimonas sp. MEB006b]